MSERATRIRIIPSEGKPFELDEETTQQLYELAEAEGEDVETFLKTAIRARDLLTRHALMEKLGK